MKPRCNLILDRPWSWPTTLREPPIDCRSCVPSRGTLPNMSTRTISITTLAVELAQFYHDLKENDGVPSQSDTADSDAEIR